MKKLLSFIVLIAVCLCITFVGCFESIDENEPELKNESEFKTVSYVKLVSGGKEIYIRSRANLIGNKEEAIPSTKSEYDKAVHPYWLYGDNNYNRFFNGMLLDESKTIASYYGLTKNDIGCYVYWSEPYWSDSKNKYEWSYFKYEFKGWKYSYVHVKVVNDLILAVYVDENFGVNSNSIAYATATTYEVTNYQIGIVYEQ